ncbi:hypothetical protein B1B_05713, partial [mine drainage metagenome]
EGQETDRLRAVWTLEDPRVVERIGGRRPSLEEESARWDRAQPLLETEEGPNGLRRPISVEEPTGLTEAVLEIPFDLAVLMEHDPESGRRWRHAVRDAFRAAFDLGWTVDDFAVVRKQHERRAGYFLRAPTSSPPVPADGN